MSDLVQEVRKIGSFLDHINVQIMTSAFGIQICFLFPNASHDII